jgi:type II secretory pathway predicted ATPase ExeA
MSSEYFGLVMDPFESAPDPRFLYLDAARRNVFAQLLSAVYECRGLVVLGCRRGLGKSTLVRHLADQLSALDSVLLLYPGAVLSCRPGMTFTDLLSSCRGRLDRRNKDAGDEERLVPTLEQAAGRGQVVTLILDDADALGDAALARLHALCQPDADDRRLLSVVLVGSAELKARLERLAGRQASAPAADLVLDLPPLGDRDIERMVRHRLVAAGHGDGNIFSPVALAEIARRSRGEPLRIVTLCSAALALAEQDGKATVSRELVERAADRIGGPDEVVATAPAGPPAPPPMPTQSRIRLQPADGGDDGGSWRSPAETEGPRSVRRLDDVAEAIRAADRRSKGAPDPHTDPHIRFAPAPSRPIPERQPPPAAGEPPLSAQPGLADQAYALYPGIRPSETRPPARRGRGLSVVLVVGLLLALAAAGGAYAVRSGMLETSGASAALQGGVDKAVHLFGSLIHSDPDADESIAGISPGSPSGGGTGAGSDLGRFGQPPARDEARAGQPYDFAPPPPQGRSGVAQGAGSGAPAPAAPPAPPPPLAQPAPAAGEQGVAALEAAPPQSPAASAGSPEAATSPNPTLSSLRPPETKPAAPQPPAGTVTASRQPQPRSEEPAPPRPEASRAPQHEPLLARGDEYLGSGDLDMARTFYQMAFERGSAEAAIRMGWTFDPQYFQRIGLRGEASPREAILWYQEALRRGSTQASSRLSDLATWLQSAAASGDLEAQRILRMWQG